MLKNPWTSFICDLWIYVQTAHLVSSLLQCDIPDGGTVPKSLYRTAEELESEENCLLTDCIYKTANIFKGTPFEVQSHYEGG